MVLKIASSAFGPIAISAFRAARWMAMHLSADCSFLPRPSCLRAIRLRSLAASWTSRIAMVTAFGGKLDTDDGGTSGDLAGSALGGVRAGAVTGDRETGGEAAATGRAVSVCGVGVGVGTGA